MKVLVTGVCGQLGHDVMNELSKRGYEGIGTDLMSEYSGIADGSAVTKMPYRSLDITDADAVDKIITEIHPDAVIHCAAWTAVDLAESFKKVSYMQEIKSFILRKIYLHCICHWISKFMVLPDNLVEKYCKPL